MERDQVIESDFLCYRTSYLDPLKIASCISLLVFFQKNLRFRLIIVASYVCNLPIHPNMNPNMCNRHSYKTSACSCLKELITFLNWKVCRRLPWKNWSFSSFHIFVGLSMYKMLESMFLDSEFIIHETIMSLHLIHAESIGFTSSIGFWVQVMNPGLFLTLKGFRHWSPP